MDKATISGIRANFSPEPLEGDDLNDVTGLYVNTFEARTGSAFESPIDDIFEACTGKGGNYIQLLLGHRGCGKSTELNNLEQRFINENITVRKIDCQKETNISNLEIEDILILISYNLLKICDDKGINIEQDNINILTSFFAAIEKEEKIGKEKEIGIDAGAGANFPVIFRLVAEVKSKILNTSQEMTTIRKTIKMRFSEWNNCINNIIEKIKDKDSGKYPVIMFENFDRILPTEKAIEMFKNGYLEKIKTYIIYTFPIYLSYDAEFDAITQFASTHIFPMIEIKKQNGEKNKTGYDIIKKIIEKRAELHLFDEEALELLTGKTGGSIRDAFNCIMEAAKYAERAKKKKITAEEVNMALNKEKYNYLSRRIEKKDYQDLKEIHEAKDKNIIEDKEKLLRFMKARVVLEYNGKRWHDIHPLIYDFLKDKWQN